MDLGRAYTFAFKDPEWTSKVGLGALMAGVPGLNFVSLGYGVELARNVARGEARPLPTWNRFEKLFVDGFWLSLAHMIYLSPLLAMGGCGLLALWAGLFLAFQGQTDQQIGLNFVLVAGVFLVGMLALSVFSFFAGLVMPAVTAQYVRRGTFAACFRFSDVWQLVRDNSSAYLLVWVGMQICSWVVFPVVFAVGTVVSFIPCLGTFAYLLLLGTASFTIWLVSGHLTGQLLVADAARQAATAAPSPTA